MGWWGNWRSTAPAHIGDLQPTDLLDCTSVSGGIEFNNTITGAQIIAGASSGVTLTVGTTPIASGPIGRVLFQNGSNLLGQDSALFWDNTNKRLGVGATPDTSTRLDVRAQGALSTDIGLRVRNSANTANILTVNGKGQIWANGSGAISTNTSFGELALNSNTSGTNNTAFGYNAGQANLTGTYNVFLGLGAGQNGTTAASSIFIGTNAGQNSNANNGIFIGQSTSLTGGLGTVAIGYVAGAGTGTHNISLGYQSGLGMTTGSTNIHIGYRTVTSGITTGNNNTIIGGCVVGAVSNNVAISDGAGNKVLWFDSVNAMVSDLKIDTVTGIKIGTTTAQKLSFWNATPIVQPTTAVASAVFVVGAGTAVNTASTFDGYTLAKVVKALRNTGILA